MVPEISEDSKQRQHEENLCRLAEFRPIDDDFMRALFHENIPLVQYVLRVILDKPDLEVISSDTQADMKRVTGARSICLDAYASDSNDKKYDIEVQKASAGANPHRARYHSSVLDVENLDEGQDFTELPDTYTIFITEKDFFKEGRPLYIVRRIIETSGKPFDDGATIIYVNGQYRGDDLLGQLMHDFNCKSDEEMKTQLLADKTRYLKKDPKGVSKMCEIMEEMQKTAEKRAEKRTRTENAEEMLRDGKLSLDDISKYSGLPLETIQELAGVKGA